MTAQADRERPTRPTLTRAHIVTTALAMIDDEGVDGFSMRKLGQRLGADPMAVYHYVRSKAGLFDAVVEAIMLEIDTTGEVPTSWDGAVNLAVHRMRDAMRAHPKALPLIATRPVTTPQVMVLIEFIASRLHAAGASPQDALLMVNCMAMFTVGHALAEVGEPVGGPEGDPYAFSDLDVAAIPTLAEAVGGGWEFDADRVFDAGLGAMIAGFRERYGLSDDR